MSQHYKIDCDKVEDRKALVVVLSMNGYTVRVGKEKRSGKSTLTETALSQTLAQQVFFFQNGERCQIVFRCRRFFCMIPAVPTLPMLHRFLKANGTKFFFQTRHLLSHPVLILSRLRF